MTLREQDPVLALVPEGWNLVEIAVQGGDWVSQMRAIDVADERDPMAWEYGIGPAPLAAVADAAKRINLRNPHGPA